MLREELRLEAVEGQRCMEELFRELARISTYIQLITRPVLPAASQVAAEDPIPRLSQTSSRRSRTT